MSRKLIDSGVSWIGKIPEGWKVCRVGKVFEVVLGKMLQSEAKSETDSLEPYFCAANVHYDGVQCDDLKQMWFSSTERNQYEVCNGDMLIVEGGAGAGGTAIVKGLRRPTYMQNSILRVRGLAGKTHASYLSYWMYSIGKRGYVDFTCNKATIPHFAKEKLSAVQMPFPPLAEQQRIAAFLDRECEKIDGLRGKIEKQIEKLDELKKSTITEAVTKGGKTWIRKRLKNVAEIQRGGSPRPIDQYMTDEETGLNWIKIGDTVKGSKYIDSVAQKIKPEGLVKTRQVHKGDLILTNSMSFGEPYILNVDGCIHDGWVCLSRLKETDKVFLYYFLLSDYCSNQFRRLVDGGVVQNLNVDKIGSCAIVLPPLAEQKEIAEYLDKKCAAIDAAKEKCRVQLEKLAEYKKSLIYEYVTGKRSVFADEPLRRDKEVA